MGASILTLWVSQEAYFRNGIMPQLTQISRALRLWANKVRWRHYLASIEGIDDASDCGLSQEFLGKLRSKNIQSKPCRHPRPNVSEHFISEVQTDVMKHLL